MYPGGYMGKILRVDLSEGKLRDEKLDETMLRKFVGGVGFGAKILYDEVPPGVEWNDPENRIIVASGPFGGTCVGGSGTICVVSKGPMTNLAGSSQANGFFGAYLKFCGYDAVIIQGRADELTYLHIKDGEAELRDAKHLSMKDTFTTEKEILNELGYRKRGASVYCIGPAGENLVRFANIMGDEGHSVSHNGLGAVMGSKRLKAIVASRGSREVPVRDPEGLRKLAEEMYRDQLEGFGGFLDKWGTAGIVESGAEAGWLPVKNYTTNVIPKSDYERITGQYIRTHFKVRPKPCWACRIRHVIEVEVTEGPYKGLVAEGPEYEVIAGMGTQIGVKDPGAVTMLGDLVDHLGMDVNESGWLLGWIMECYEKGILSKEDLDGIEMRWGDAESAKRMLEKIAHRDGCGALFAEGVKRSAERIGGEAVKMGIYAMKGAAPRGHDHRGHGRWTELLDTCVSDTSTCQTVSGQTVRLPPEVIDPKSPPEIKNPFSPEEVSTHIGKGCGWDQFTDCLGFCRFNRGWKQTVPILNAITGWDFTIQEAMEVGRRVVNVLRVFNLRHGLDTSLERPSPRYGSTPIDGPNKGISIMKRWDFMVRNYRRLMGWDGETGIPLPETLKKLGLEELIKDLPKLR